MGSCLRLLLLASAASYAWADETAPTPAELLDEAIEAEEANAEGLHRYVFFEDRTIEHFNRRGKTTRRRSERYSVAWLDGQEIAELIALNGRKPKQRDIESRQRSVAEMFERIRQEHEASGKPKGGRALPMWHFEISVGDREERQAFGLTKFDSDAYDLAPLEDGLGFRARPSSDAVAERPPDGPALFEHRVWLDPESRAWTRWESRVVVDGPVLAAGSRHEIVRTFVEDDIWLEERVEHTCTCRVSEFERLQVTRRSERSGFRRFFDVESAIRYQEAILDEQ
jgi:hypothetical protein